jgi:hypothetical protein
MKRECQGKKKHQIISKHKHKHFMMINAGNLRATGSYAFAKTIIRKQHIINNAALIFSKLTIKIPNLLLHSCKQLIGRTV